MASDREKIKALLFDSVHRGIGSVDFVPIDAITAEVERLIRDAAERAWAMSYGGCCGYDTPPPFPADFPLVEEKP